MNNTEKTNFQTPFFCYDSYEKKKSLLINAITSLAHYILDFISDTPHLYRCVHMTVSYTAKAWVKKDKPHNFHVTDKKVLNVFVHGYLHNKTGFIKYEKRFLNEKMGSVLSLTLSSTLQSIDTSAEEVFQAIEKAKEELDPDVEINLIGHSMGGLIASACALKYPLNTKKVVAIGSPFKGTLFAPLGLGSSANEMRHNSQYLQDLIQKMMNTEGIRYYAAAGTRDQVIKPWNSCHPWDDHPNQHEFDDIGHLGLLFDDRVIDWVVKCIKEPEF